MIVTSDVPLFSQIALIFLLVVIAYVSYNAEKPIILFNPTAKNERLVARCPGLLSSYFPTFWAISGHIQSGLFAFWPGFSHMLSPLKFERQMVNLRDGGSVSLDWVLNAREGMDHETLPEDAPILLILTGVIGKKENPYVKRIVRDSAKDRSWRYAVKSWRGIDVPLTSAMPETWGINCIMDVDECVGTIHKRYPKAPILGVGFSHGGTMLASYMGYQGAKMTKMGGKILSGVSISAPTCLKRTVYHVEKSPYPYDFVNTAALVMDYTAAPTRQRRRSSTVGSSAASPSPPPPPSSKDGRAKTEGEGGESESWCAVEGESEEEEFSMEDGGGLHTTLAPHLPPDFVATLQQHMSISKVLMPNPLPLPPFPLSLPLPTVDGMQGLRDSLTLARLQDNLGLPQLTDTMSLQQLRGLLSAAMVPGSGGGGKGLIGGGGAGAGAGAGASIAIDSGVTKEGGDADSAADSDDAADADDAAAAAAAAGEKKEGVVPVSAKVTPSNLSVNTEGAETETATCEGEGAGVLSPPPSPRPRVPSVESEAELAPLRAYLGVFPSLNELGELPTIGGSLSTLRDYLNSWTLANFTPQIPGTYSYSVAQLRDYLSLRAEALNSAVQLRDTMSLAQVREQLVGDNLGEGLTKLREYLNLPQFSGVLNSMSFEQLQVQLSLQMVMEQLGMATNGEGKEEEGGEVKEGKEEEKEKKDGDVEEEDAGEKKDTVEEKKEKEDAGEKKEKVEEKKEKESKTEEGLSQEEQEKKNYDKKGQGGYVRYFHDNVTIKFTGHESAAAFLEDVSRATMKHLADVKQPLLCLFADDDPVTPLSAFHRMEPLLRSSDSIMLLRTQKGGHCGYFHGALATSWMDQGIFQFLDANLEDFHQAATGEPVEDDALSTSTGVGEGKEEVEQELAQARSAVEAIVGNAGMVGDVSEKKQQQQKKKKGNKKKQRKNSQCGLGVSESGSDEERRGQEERVVVWSAAYSKLLDAYARALKESLASASSSSSSTPASADAKKLVNELVAVVAAAAAHLKAQQKAREVKEAVDNEKKTKAKTAGGGGKQMDVGVVVVDVNAGEWADVHEVIQRAATGLETYLSSGGTNSVSLPTFPEFPHASLASMLPSMLPRMLADSTRFLPQLPALFLPAVPRVPSWLISRRVYAATSWIHAMGANHPNLLGARVVGSAVVCGVVAISAAYLRRGAGQQ